MSNHLPTTFHDVSAKAFPSCNGILDSNQYANSGLMYPEQIWLIISMMYHNFFFFCPMCTMQYSNNYTNFRQNEFSSIHRRLVQVTSFPQRIYCRRGTSTYECCTKPSVVSQTAHLRNYQRQFNKSRFLACVLVRSLLVKAYLESATVVLCPHIYKSV